MVTQKKCCNLNNSIYTLNNPYKYVDLYGNYTSEIASQQSNISSDTLSSDINSDVKSSDSTDTINQSLSSEYINDNALVVENYRQTCKSFNNSQNNLYCQSDYN